MNTKPLKPISEVNMGDIQRMTYKGYEIEPIPTELADSKGWSLVINIWEFSGPEHICHPFSAKEIYKTQEEAIKYGYKQGRQIVDKKF